MKHYAPSYYPRFACLADKCRHSCCVGWEIDVDEETLARYDALSGGYGDFVQNSIDRADENGLCRIILEWGEGALCTICREHPRFYHQTSRGLEAGLGMACEEACRLILTSDGYFRFVEIGEDGEAAEATAFDSLPFREKAYGILSNRTLPYEERLSRLAELAGLSPSRLPDDEWRAILSSLEYLDEAHRDLFSLYTSFPRRDPADETMLERALAYFLFRHMTPAVNEEDAAFSLTFCLFCECLLASLFAQRKEKTFEKAIDLARILSEELEYSEENTDCLREVLFDLLPSDKRT